MREQMKQKLFFINVIAIYFIMLFVFLSCTYNIFLAGGSKTSLNKVLTTNTIDLVYQLNSPNVIKQLLESPSQRTKILQTLNILIDKRGGDDKLRAIMGIISVYSKTTSLREVIDEDTSATLLKIVRGTLDFTATPRDLIKEIFQNANSSNVTSIMNNALINYEFINSLGEGIRDNNSKFPKGTSALAGDYVEQAIIIAVLKELHTRVKAPTGSSDTARISLIKDFVTNDASTVTFNITGFTFGDIFGTISNPSVIGYILIGAKMEAFINAF